MKLKMITFAAVLAAASMAAAHAEVSNETVKARMDGMKAIGGAMKTLGGMAGGKMEFDAAAAQAALDTVAMEAAAVPTKFEAQETDPESEAKDDIWANWDDFVAKAGALEAAAKGADGSSAAGLGAAMGAMGGACKACHSAYRL